MSDVLSQAEIDALLSALTRGELSAEEIREAEGERRIRTYDFRRAMRFSKDHIRIIARIHEHFARLMTTHLSGQLRSVIHIQVETVDQLPYEEFIRSIPTLTVLQVLELTPLPGKVVVELNPQVVFAMLDRLMGGAIKGPYRERELTEIEVALFKRVTGVIGDFFAEAWRNIADIAPVLRNLESNPQFLQLAMPNETVLVITLSARIGPVSGLINVCLPHATLEPLLPKLSTQHFMDATRTRRSSGGTEEQRLQQHIFGMQAEVTVILGSTELTMQEVLDLQAGDVIPLAAPIRAPLTVCVNGVPTFLASVGRRKQRYAVRVVSPWKEVSGSE